FGWAPFGTGDSRDLTSLEDEHLGLGDPGGTGAILAGEIGRPRVGPMRDIAATIQPEQDDLVRRELGDSVCVQGAPGTGKTAVGLHRAAYLLYTYPQRIRRGGLLILGPNRTFLHYIAEVLPALGEIDIRQSTIDDEIARHPVRAEDPQPVAELKHDVRMATVLHRALHARITTPEEPVAVPDGAYRRRIALDDLTGIVAQVRAEEPPYAVGRERVRTRAVALLQRQAERTSGPPNGAWLRRMGRAASMSAYVD
ncbi:AAA family ATPase, partial [Streptomyces sp. SID3343]|nr:AAA family ATPase [Streptomyces sp. SID3343]